MHFPGLATLLGYDRALLHKLSPGERHALDWLASGVVFACALSCAPLGYCVWLATHHVGLTWALGLSFSVLLAAMLRLSVAGSPYASVSAGAATYAGPLVVLAVAAALAAQPAQLFLMREELDVPLAKHRQELVAQHEVSSGCADSGDCARYRVQLQQCDFVALQLQALWARPARASRNSVLFVCLLLLPTVLGRLIAGPALRRYERLRLLQARALVRHAAERTRVEIERALAEYVTYAPKSASRGRLRQPWQKSRLT